ncbi:hypothetical protein JTL86_33695 [Pseudomonas aeruginosa]|uniref:Uncharacterized protein n=1 Tax=Pseudomonas aeruginosa TaxID=287 RepID=A0A8F1IFW7_PSEAI|nr:hypothetical protein [Pseudomonas aeruginosa]QWP89877.1 hypothetical protein [Pseudomonas aeruginosa]
MSWNIEELVTFFERKGIPPSAYSLFKDSDETHCLIKQGDEWLVYYSEKGKRNELGWGKTEAQALNILKLFVLEGCKQI